MNVMNEKVRAAKLQLQKEKDKKEKEEFLSKLSLEEREEYLKFEKERQEEAWEYFKNFIALTGKFNGPYSR